MEIKIGQKLYVKEKHFVSFSGHKINDICVVKGFNTGGAAYPVNVQFVDSMLWEVYSYEEIEKYFYVLAEWRDNQINSILDGD